MEHEVTAYVDDRAFTWLSTDRMKAGKAGKARRFRKGERRVGSTERII
jgi:hypothetical protein